MKDYSEHALTAGSGASAVAYVEAEGADGSTWWGVGMDSSILDASLHAVVSARPTGPGPTGRLPPPDRACVFDETTTSPLTKSRLAQRFRSPPRFR